MDIDTARWCRRRRRRRVHDVQFWFSRLFLFVFFFSVCSVLGIKAPFRQRGLVLLRNTWPEANYRSTFGVQPIRCLFSFFLFFGPAGQNPSAPQQPPHCAGLVFSSLATACRVFDFATRIVGHPLSTRRQLGSRHVLICSDSSQLWSRGSGPARSVNQGQLSGPGWHWGRPASIVDRTCRHQIMHFVSQSITYVVSFNIFCRAHDLRV